MNPYKGPVWKAVEDGQALVFDRDGSPVGLPRRDVEVRQANDGGRVEIMRLARRNAGSMWSMERLNGVDFFTGGAALAETAFTAQGTPVQTVFKNDHDEELSQIRYVCDEKGRVLEAAQSGWPPSAVSASGAVVEAVREYMGTDVSVRVTFAYDNGGRVLEQTGYFGDQMHERILTSYNEHGDKLTFGIAGQEQYRFEYDYDEWGNWTRQVVHHPDGAIENRREITYYE